jgi:hypothetical protein
MAFNHQRPRLIPSQLRDVPHFIFGRVEGAEFITLHLFFPHLTCQHEFKQLTDLQFSRWFDEIFYPALSQVYDPVLIQHLPASYRRAKATCRAPRMENCLHGQPSSQSQLQMSYFLPAEGLHQLWQQILLLSTQPTLQDFRDPELLLQAKGTKLRFKAPGQSSNLFLVMEKFERELRQTLDFSRIHLDRFYIDLGKKICPKVCLSPPNASTEAEPQTFLWRRCCLNHHLDSLYDGRIPLSGHNFFQTGLLRHIGGMTMLTPSYSRLRRGGLWYVQWYNLTKETIDAARTFPFQNPDLPQLALDSRLQSGAQNIHKRAGSLKTVEAAYLASKRRCHYSLLDSRQRSFGVREEYRISWRLFQRLQAALHALQDQLKTPFAQSITIPTYVWVIRSPALFD